LRRVPALDLRSSASAAGRSASFAPPGKRTVACDGGLGARAAIPSDRGGPAMEEEPMNSRTYTPKLGEVEKKWFVVDATGIPLGRLSTAVAHVLAGKHKPQYATHHDVGDFVIVVNAEKVVLTGKKSQEKIYWRTSGRPGGKKEETANELLQRFPERLVEKAVKGMLPKNTLGRHQHKKLKVYAGSDHPHAAQMPAPLELSL
jgi:large subunit ribosomal protein L13